MGLTTQLKWIVLGLQYEMLVRTDLAYNNRVRLISSIYYKQMFDLFQCKTLFFNYYHMCILLTCHNGHLESYPFNMPKYLFCTHIFPAGLVALKQLVPSLLQSRGGLLSVGFYLARSVGMYSMLQGYASTVPLYPVLMFPIFPSLPLVFIPYFLQDGHNAC